MMVLCRVLKNHPAMSMVIIHETLIFLQRPGLKQSQRTYGISFLNKIAALSARNDEKVRTELFKVYFTMFQSVLKKPEEVKEMHFKKDRTKSKK